MVNSAPGPSARLAARTDPPPWRTILWATAVPSPMALAYASGGFRGNTRIEQSGQNLHGNANHDGGARIRAPGSDLNFPALGHCAHGVAEQVNQHALPGPVPRQLDPRLDVASKANGPRAASIASSTKAIALSGWFERPHPGCQSTEELRARRRRAPRCAGSPRKSVATAGRRRANRLAQLKSGRCCSNRAADR